MHPDPQSQQLTIGLYRDNLNGTGTPLAEAYSNHVAWTITAWGEPYCANAKSTIYYMLAWGTSERHLDGASGPPSLASSS